MTSKKLDPQTIIIALIGVISSYAAGHYQLVVPSEAAGPASITWMGKELARIDGVLRDRAYVVNSYMQFKENTDKRIDRIDDRFNRLDDKIDKLTDAIIDLIKKKNASVKRVREDLAWRKNG